MTALAALPLVLASGTTKQPIAISAPPTLIEAKIEKLKYEPVQFKTQDKLTLHAQFYAPSKKGRAPAVLLIHDEGKDADSMASVAESLMRKGFAVLSVDLRGHGESASESCDWSKITDLQVKAQTWTFAMRDLEAATGYLRDLKNVHNSNLSVVGVGAGAVLAARYAYRDENARAVVLIEPTAEIYGFNMLKDVSELGGLPVLIMSTSESRSESTRVKNAAAKANDGIDYVKLQTLKPKNEDDVFSDKRLATEMTKFLKSEAMDKR
ncbi:MAG: alpha-beta hydrolase superfamily lysophospholipase [Planctomycetota bacterium]|jgi:alpha-beta hydrolase superfamily lysophospholipase